MKEIKIPILKLGSEQDIRTLLKRPSKKTVRAAVQVMASETAQKAPIEQFLMHLSIVSYLLKLKRVDWIMLHSAQTALGAFPLIQEPISGLLEPYFEALDRVCPNMKVYSEIGRYLKCSIQGYMYGRDPHCVMFEGTLEILESLDTWRRNMSPAGFGMAVSYLQEEILRMAAPLYKGHRYLIFVKKPSLGTYDLFAKAAMDEVISYQDAVMGDHRCGIPSRREDILSSIEEVSALDYSEREKAAWKILCLKKIAGIAASEIGRGKPEDLEKVDDLLSLGYALEKELNPVVKDVMNKELSAMAPNALRDLYHAIDVLGEYPL